MPFLFTSSSPIIVSIVHLRHELSSSSFVISVGRKTAQNFHLFCTTLQCKFSHSLELFALFSRFIRSFVWTSGRNMRRCHKRDKPHSTTDCRSFTAVTSSFFIHFSLSSSRHHLPTRTRLPTKVTRFFNLIIGEDEVDDERNLDCHHLVSLLL